MLAQAVEAFHILIVDDEPGDVELTRLAIQESRFVCHTTVARDGVEAMAMLSLQDSPVRPDLILLDLNMPRMNGSEVLKALKAEPTLARIPVVVLTTSQAETDVMRSYEGGAAGFVTKPVNVEQLFQVIQSIEEYWFSVVRNPNRKA